MNNLYYFAKCMTIVICGTAALMIGVSLMCNCSSKPAQTYTAKADTITYEQSHEVVSDTDKVQLNICERLLDECAEAGILDYKGVCAYRKISHNPSVSRYMELIDECEYEENFYDTVGSGDTWCLYVHYVLDPRGLAD